MNRTILKLILISLLMHSCASKKESSKVSTSVQNDSVYLKIETIKSNPVTNEFVINDICDSVTGNAREFSQSLNIGNDSFSARSENNDLYLSASIIDSIKSKAVQDYQRTFTSKDEKESAKVVKTVVPVWCWYSLGINLLLIAGIGFYFGKNFTNPLEWIKKMFT